MDDDDDDDECLFVNKRRDAQCGCCDHGSDTGCTTFPDDESYGVQGGMSLPADEAQSAETPEYTQDVPDPPPPTHPDQRTRRDKRKMLVTNNCQCCCQDTPAQSATSAHVPATSATAPTAQGDESEQAERARREEFDRLHPAFDNASAERVSREAQELSDPLMVEKRRAQEAFAEARARAVESFSKRQALEENASINLLETTVRDNLIAVAAEAKRIRVAMDSAAVANVINPEDLPNDVEFAPNETDDHFVGANDSVIERYGTCATILTGEQGSVGCEWDMANVTRPLHSVAKVAGPKGGPGKQDVLFDNDDCYVVAPGVVKAIMKHIAAVAHYERDGNLYLASMTVAPFPRPGHAS